MVATECYSTTIKHLKEKKYEFSESTSKGNTESKETYMKIPAEQNPRDGKFPPTQSMVGDNTK